MKRKADLVIDTVTKDTLLDAAFTVGSDRATALVQSFEQFIAQHKDEITALQILYSRPTRAPLKFEDVKALADALHAPPLNIDEGALWQAYATLRKDKVKGAKQRRLLTDLVSLVRFAMQQTNELVPYPERVQANFKAWLAQHQQTDNNPFTTEQQHWLEMIRDPNRDAYQIALQRMPNTLIVLRNWSFDDNNGDRWNELMARSTWATRSTRSSRT